MTCGHSLPDALFILSVSYTHLLPPDARPADLHGNRAKNPDGSWNGFYAERRFSLNYMVIMDIEGDQVEYTLVPLDLDMRRDNCLKRGLPEIPEEEVGQEINAFLTEMSKKYRTQFTYHADTRMMKVK